MTTRDESKCLHCRLSMHIRDLSRELGPDGVEIATALARCLGEVIASMDERELADTVASTITRNLPEMIARNRRAYDSGEGTVVILDGRSQTPLNRTEVIA